MVAERLSGTGGTIVAALPGSRVAVPARVDTVELPGGSRVAVRDTLSVPQRAGVYFWVRGGARVGAVVVNGEAEESVLDRLSDEVLARRVGAGRVTHDDGELVRATYGAAARRPLGGVLLVAALVALLAEALLAGRLAALLPRRAAG
jgi:hypothetical protein